jgi:hypothetical protein
MVNIQGKISIPMNSKRPFNFILSTISSIKGEIFLFYLTGLMFTTLVLSAVLYDLSIRKKIKERKELYLCAKEFVTEANALVRKMELTNQALLGNDVLSLLMPIMGINFSLLSKEQVKEALIFYQNSLLQKYQWQYFSHLKRGCVYGSHPKFYQADSLIIKRNRWGQAQWNGERWEFLLLKRNLKLSFKIERKKKLISQINFLIQEV